MKITKITKLPQFLRGLQKDIQVTQKELGNLNYQLTEQANSIKLLKDEFHAIAQKLKVLGQRDAELEHLIHAAAQPKAGNKQNAKSSTGSERFVDNHLLDQFYMELENNLRGTEDEIKQKQAVYMPLFAKSKVDYKKHPVIDLGSGRGEFLELLHEHKIRGVGVDLNKTMVDRMLEKKFEAVQDDAVGYLREAASNSLGGIVGFHIAEHLPFEELLTLISEAQRTLVPGGFLLLETPNPENVSVGSFTFYMDPSHLKPLPPALVEFMAKFKGFDKVEIKRLQPEISEAELKKITDKNLLKTYQRMYGPRDYALVAYK